ncbi:MAG: efflux RND transporter periplasmic adaptor subunit [Bdellovibrionales bacterium]|nr:efflux RND transporter periplasmic adaptor subunit [Bdellovibrionales bacterium]
MIKKAAEYIRIPKKVFFSVLAGIALAITFWSLRPQLTPVDLGLVSEGVFRRSIVDEGITHFKERHIISAPADGITPTIKIEAGDSVEKGKLLFNFLWDHDFPMLSPINGYVLKVFEKDRRHILRGTPILEVGNPQSLEVITKLLSEEVIDVRTGQKAIITNWGKDEPLEAEVIKIEPAAKEEISALGVKEQRVNVYLRMTSDKDLWQNLGDGFRVDVAVITDEIENAKLLPVGALFASEGKPAVFVYQDKKIQLIPVEVGKRNRDFAELKSGMAVNTQVVLYPGSSLRSGDKVKPRTL